MLTEKGVLRVGPAQGEQKEEGELGDTNEEQLLFTLRVCPKCHVVTNMILIFVLLMLLCIDNLGCLIAGQKCEERLPLTRLPKRISKIHY